MLCGYGCSARVLAIVVVVQSSLRELGLRAPAHAYTLHAHLRRNWREMRVRQIRGLTVVEMLLLQLILWASAVTCGKLMDRIRGYGRWCGRCGRTLATRC